MYVGAVRRSIDAQEGGSHSPAPTHQVIEVREERVAKRVLRWRLPRGHVRRIKRRVGPLGT